LIAKVALKVELIYTLVTDRVIGSVIVFRDLKPSLHHLLWFFSQTNPSGQQYVAEEEKQLLSVRDPIREREAYCSSQRERELLISFLNLLFSGREWDMFFVCMCVWHPGLKWKRRNIH